jgi:Prokaryotic cytochrome b561
VNPIQWATSPYGETVPIHIAWYLIWVFAIAGLAFLIGHAIWVSFAKEERFQPEELSAAEIAAVPKEVPRHSLAARLFHWIMAAAMLTLLFTAFLPKVGVQFAWVEWHWMAGIVLIASILFHIIHASFFMDFWSIWPDKIDIQDAMNRGKIMAGEKAPLPHRFAQYRAHRPVGRHHRLLHALPRAHSVFHPESLPLQLHDVGLHVRIARFGGSGPDRSDHGAHLYGGPPRKVGHDSLDAGWNDHERTLSGAP